MKSFKDEIVFNNKKINIEFGEIAKQANGSCVVKIGETIILSTVVASKEQKSDIDFLPLTVDYRERTYSVGKIPGGFFKRETKPKNNEILTSRLIDRSIRPVFHKHWRNTTQVSVLLLSYDCENDPIIAAILGTSIALCSSDLPFNIPISTVRICKLNNKFIINPLLSEQKKSSLNLVISGNDKAITMVEGNAKELPESDIIYALKIAQKTIKDICEYQKKIISKNKINIMLPSLNATESEIKNEILSKINSKQPYDWYINKNSIIEEISNKYSKESILFISNIVDEIFYKKSREFIINKKTHLDGRKLDEIRDITCKVGILPRAHGSSIFTRGRTQALATVTLGTPSDMQIIDDLGKEYKERFMLNYNFPGFATGEPKNERFISRREIGHGNLAKMALEPILPLESNFCYTIRLVSDILESNGSSSMATVCGGSLALFNAGVPVKSSCAGIAMGLIKEKNEEIILTDIMGLEDHIGDMDLKVAGTKKGITALQMDIKIMEIDISTLEKALYKAKEARFFILDVMDTVISVPQKNISHYAPSLTTLTLPKNKIGDLIGPGGKNIRNLQDINNVKIDVEKDGKVFISGLISKDVDIVKQHIKSMLSEIEVGKIYNGEITKLMKFGAFVKIFPGREGLVHISNLNKKYSFLKLKEGDKIMVKVLEINKNGKINLITI
ncbi:MAG: polyribonucleotide nucleotidyltransferase [Endomicrobium sp.]|nr:polyribonucleotide nucleotidyltransferase [Endomicrobium sp.]